MVTLVFNKIILQLYKSMETFNIVDYNVMHNVNKMDIIIGVEMSVSLLSK